MLSQLLEGNPLFRSCNIVTNHHPHAEREKTTVIVTGSSLDFIKLSPDNFMRIEYSKLSLASVANSPGKFVRWVLETCDEHMEDPEERVEPGIYYLQVKDVRDDGRTAILRLQALRRVEREEVLYNYLGEPEVYLDHGLVRDCSLSLRANRQRLVEDTHYTFDPVTGTITFIPGQEPQLRTQLIADYVYSDPSAAKDDLEVQADTNNTSILPGISLSFSDEFILGDTLAVVYTAQEEAAASIFGGRMTIPLQFETKAQDTVTAEKISDLLAITLQGPAKMRLENEGIILDEVSVSGEQDDAEDDLSGELSYKYTLSAGFESEWQLRLPISKKIIEGSIVNFLSDVNPYTVTEDILIQATLESYISGSLGPVYPFPEE